MKLKSLTKYEIVALLQKVPDRDKTTAEIFLRDLCGSRYAKIKIGLPMTSAYFKWSEKTIEVIKEAIEMARQH